MTNIATNIKTQIISLTISEFERLKTAISTFEWSIFLDSADKNHVDSKWSIISAMPIATMQSFSESLLFKQGSLVEQTDCDPFVFLNKKRYLIFGQQQYLGELPFIGGVLGSIDYEIGYQLEQINNSDKPLSQSLPELSLGFYDWALIYNHEKSQFSLVSQHVTGSYFSIETHFQDRLDWLMKMISEQKKDHSFKLLTEWQSNMNKQQYADKFDSVQSYILSGDCYQINLAQRFQAKYIGDEYQAYQALLNENRPPFAAYLRLPEQVILSLSPERFIKLHNDSVETKPIKGTSPRFSNLDLDLKSMKTLQQSEKDRSENLMIVDLLRNDIGRVCEIGTVNVPSLFDIESFPAVHHLVSTVKGKLSNDYHVEDLLSACFPGGSITGTPKIRAMEIISELEPHTRQTYCGSIGYISATGDMDMNIAIRTLICVKGDIYCWAGGGLVADSKLDSEYQECFDKVSKILPCLSALNVNE